MLISKLAEQTGSSKHTIRHYEEFGLFHPIERVAGSRIYKEYSKEAVFRMELISLGKLVFLYVR